MLELKITGKKGPDIPKEWIGLFLEDINYAIDGGLYAEMLENRDFESLDAYGCREEGYYLKYDGLYAWSAWEAAKLEIVQGSPVAEQNPHYLRVTAQRTGGFFNRAYDGLYMKKGVKCRFCFYARCVSYQGALHIRITKDGSTLMEESIHVQEADCDGWKRWIQYKAEFTPDRDIAGAVPVIVMEQAGIMEFDHFSMMPEDAVCGVFRKDLAELLKELHPGFLRFPGGCVAEGATLSNRYRFQDTLCNKEQRRHNWNRWAVSGTEEANGYHSPYSHYGQTLGIGFYEYFLLCEYLGAKPLPVLGVGLACQYQSCERVEPEDARIREYIQDFLDLIEFANGSADTRWGGVRAAMGHPEPFGLEMVGVGNEQWDTPQSRFFERYCLFEREIHRAYPNIRLVGTAGPEVDSKRFADAWEFYKKHKDDQGFVYAVDEHCYAKPEWFISHTDYFDEASCGIPVFFGEYAAHPDRSAMKNPIEENNLQGALAEAAFLTGMGRNSDTVVMACYAPLLARFGYEQWKPNLVWFDAQKACRTPNYYVQQMFANNLGDYNIVIDEAPLPCQVSYDCERKELAIKLVNTQEEAVTVRIVPDSIWQAQNGAAEETVKEILLTGEKGSDYNTLKQEKIHAEKRSIVLEEGCYEMPPLSFAVLRIPTPGKAET